MKKCLIVSTVSRQFTLFERGNIEVLKELGYEVHCVANYSDATNELKELGIIEHNIDIQRSPFSLKNIKAYKQLKTIIDSDDYDLIHCHSPMGGVLARLAAKKTRRTNHMRVIYTAHGFHFFRGAPLINWMLYYPVEKFLSKYTDCIITINNEDYDLAKRKFKAKQIELVHGVGVDENKFNFKMCKEEKHNLRESLGLKDDDFVIIYVAELSKRKNQGMLIKSIKEIISEGNDNIKVLLPGKDSLNGKYQKLVEEYNLQEHIKFLGFRNDIPQLMKVSNLCVSTSKQEGLPVNIIEAMFCQIPIIATNCRGNRDLIQKNDRCSIVNIDNIEELKTAILNEILKKREYEQTINIKDYSKEQIKNNMICIYRSILQKKILHLLSSNKYAGAENMACQIIECFKGEFNMVYCSPKGEIQDKLEREDINYIPIEKVSLIEIRKVLKKFKPDIIHAHDFKASVMTAIFFGNYNKISHLHQSPEWIKRINMKSILYYLTTFFYDTIIIVSKGIKESYVFNDRVKSKTVLLNNYIDSKSIVKKASNKNKENIDLLFVGRLEQVKNPIEFINIVYKVKEKFPNIRATIIGYGSLFNQCTTKIKEKNLYGNIQMLGYKDNPFPYILKSRILINTSKKEGFGLSIVEGILLDNVILSSNTDGAQEILGSDYFGICNNVDEFVKKTTQLLNDSEEYKKILNVCKGQIEQYIDEKSFKNTLREIYKMR